MILRKKLVEESGLTRDRAVFVIRRLDAAHDITPVKDRYNHNAISYSDADAEKIKQALKEEEESIAAAQSGAGIEEDTQQQKTRVGSGSPLPAGKETEKKPAAPGATSVKELAETPGSKKREKPTELKPKEEKKPPGKLKELLGDNQQTLFLIAGGVGLLLFLLWLRGRSAGTRPPKGNTAQGGPQGASSPRDMSDAELKALRDKYNAVFRP